MQPLVVDDVDAAEVVADVAARELVVVAGNEDDARKLARLAQQLLDDVVVRLQPEPAAAQPAVDDVADEIERLAPVRAQEVSSSASALQPGVPLQVRSRGCGSADSATMPQGVPAPAASSSPTSAPGADVAQARRKEASRCMPGRVASLHDKLQSLA